jgi:hypothetical protein
VYNFSEAHFGMPAEAFLFVDDLVGRLLTLTDRSDVILISIGMDTGVVSHNAYTLL